MAAVSRARCAQQHNPRNLIDAEGCLRRRGLEAERASASEAGAQCAKAVVGALGELRLWPDGCGFSFVSVGGPLKKGGHRAADERSA